MVDEWTRRWTQTTAFSSGRHWHACASVETCCGDWRKTILVVISNFYFVLFFNSIFFIFKFYYFTLSFLNFTLTTSFLFFLSYILHSHISFLSLFLSVHIFFVLSVFLLSFDSSPDYSSSYILLNLTLDSFIFSFFFSVVLFNINLTYEN